ncbi:hypothetical protein QCN29_31110 [Streptomyces sp. HNM0663]|uniref:Molecular chaperone DnaJ n=1 Tax=Streptomyces chengmaiensis TaxID=3040919 RepID=A0ABT6HWS1_9ACTN|nr:hypothetical protein [Streptomyces chengmaiensis]MDH2393148.1 hypothetical protein [Streptomyces chengmaiensis]
MPEHTPAVRRCPDCDGFPVVAIGIGGRDRHGHLRTAAVHCPACHGTGTVTTRPVLARAGR